MTTPTSNPVPSNAPQDLLNNSEVFDSLINASGYHTNRKGGSLPSYITAIAELGFNAPIAFTTGINVDSSRVTVTNGGNRYFARPDAVPFVTTGTFNPAQWSLFDESFPGSEIAQIGTYSLLRAYAGAATHVYVVGRLNMFDGAFGYFSVDLADVTSSDNDGTVIVDTLDRRWKRQFTGKVNAVWFGAVPFLSTSSSAAINAAGIASNWNVHIPAGNYLLTTPLLVHTINPSITGDGAGKTSLWVDAMAMPIVTVAGLAARTAIWVGSSAGAWNDGIWQVGAELSGFSVHGNGFVGSCVLVNRTIIGSYSDLWLSTGDKGFRGIHSGWGSGFDSVHSYGHVISAFNLDTYWNGCTFTDCKAYGDTQDTQVLVDISNDCYGLSWTGGYIEKGLLGVRCINSQIAISGTDFEALSEGYMRVEGNSNFAAPPSSVDGCTFVGAPTVGFGCGFKASIGAVSVTNSFFINQGALPPAGVFAFNGVSGGDARTGFGQLCISESGNTFRGWGNQIATGEVFNISTAELVGKQSVQKLQVGDTSTLPAFSAWNTSLLGFSQFNKAFEFNFSNSIGVQVFGNESYGMGSLYAAGSGLDNYIQNNSDKFTSRTAHVSNFQGTANYGSYETVAQVVTASSTSAIGTSLDTIANSFRPLSDNALDLGSAGNRWAVVRAGTGAINTSDGRLKQQIKVLSAQEKAVATKLKASIKTYKFNDAVEAKSENARIHVGVIAQEVIEIFASEGLDATKYALLCYDEWEDKGDGTAAGNRYGIRYEELLAFIISAM